MKVKIVKSSRNKKEEPSIVDLEELEKGQKEMMKCSECHQEYRELFSHLDHPAPVCRKCMKELGL